MITMNKKYLNPQCFIIRRKSMKKNINFPYKSLRSQNKKIPNFIGSDPSNLMKSSTLKLIFSLTK